MEKTMKIEGMMCPRCVAHVEKALDTQAESRPQQLTALSRQNVLLQNTCKFLFLQKIKKIFILCCFHVFERV